MFWPYSCRQLQISRKVMLPISDRLLMGKQILRCSPLSSCLNISFQKGIKNISHSSFLSMSASTGSVKNASRHIPSCENDISSYILKYQQEIYTALDIQLDVNNIISNYKHVLHNFQEEKISNLTVRCKYFEDVLEYLKLHSDGGDLGHSIDTLKFLTNLFLPRDNFFILKLNEIFHNNLNLVAIHELSILTQCAVVNDNISMCVQAVQRMKILLETRSIPLTSSTTDLSNLFRYLSHFMSPTMLDLCTSFILDYISNKPALDLPSLALFCELADGAEKEGTNILQERIFRSGISSLHTQFDVSTLDTGMCHVIGLRMDSLFGSTSLCSKIRQQCQADILDKGSVLTPVEALRYAFFLPPRNRSIQLKKKGKAFSKEVFSKPLLQYIKECDNHSIFMFLKLFQHTRLPWKAVSELHERLVKIFEQSSLEQQERLFDHDGEILPLLYHFVTTLVNFGVCVSEKLLTVVSRQCCPDAHVPNVTRTKAPYVALSLTSRLLSDKLLGPEEMKVFFSVMNQMPLSSLMCVNSRLEMANRKDLQSPAVKKQTKQLARQTREVFYDKVSSTNHIPANILSQEMSSLWSVPQWTIEQSGMMQALIAHLGRWTRDQNDNNCLQAIEILSVAASHSPLYKPSLFENLLQFIYSCDPMPIRAFLSLLQIMSSAAYLPRDFEKFASTGLRFQEETKLKKSLSAANQVMLAHCLSVYKLYDQKAVSSIFSIEFLSTLEKELEDLKDLHGQPVEVAFYHRCLYLLNRSVTLECPDMAVFPFTVSPDAHKNRSPPPSELVNSVRRIFQESPYILTGTESDYGHRIDLLVCFDQNCEVIDSNCSDSDICFRLAFLYHSSSDLCHKAKEKRTGHTMASVRQLKLLDYFVVEVPHHRLFGMDMHSDEAIDDYLREQITHAIGPRFLFT